MREHTFWLRMLLGISLLLSGAAGMAQDREHGVMPNTVLVGADGKFEAIRIPSWCVQHRGAE